MVVLVDTNILADVLMKREPYSQEAQEILVKCAAGRVSRIIKIKIEQRSTSKQISMEHKTAACKTGSGFFIITLI